MPAKRKYRWEEWFGQPETVIVRGVDYYCSQAIMWQQVRTNAYLRGVRVKVTDLNDRLVINVIDNEVPYTDKVTIPG